MQLNSAPLITHEAVKGLSERPLNPTPSVFNISTEISQKYNTRRKEVILNNLRDFKGWNDSFLGFPRNTKTSKKRNGEKKVTPMSIKYKS